MDQKINEIFQYALKLEEDGIKFYTESKEKTSNEFGKQIFEFLIGEEKKHIEIINKIMSDSDISEDLQKMTENRTNIKTVFSGIDKEYKEKIESNPDDIKALEISMELEDKGYKYYKQEAEKMEGANKNILIELASQESIHYELLEKTLAFYKDPSSWYLIEEKGSVEG